MRDNKLELFETYMYRYMYMYVYEMQYTLNNHITKSNASNLDLDLCNNIMVHAYNIATCTLYMYISAAIII